MSQSNPLNAGSAYGVATDAQIEAAHAAAVAAFRTGRSKKLDFRRGQLRQLRRFVVEHEADIAAALLADLRRPQFEAVVCEVVPVLTEIDHCLAHLDEWAADEHTQLPALFAPAVSKIVKEPYGVALVMGAFNYPVSLTLSPLLGAIAAGNCAVVKPSEMSSAVEKLLAEQLPNYLDRDCYHLICGDIPATQKLLSLRWDKIFFTGSTRVGRIVMTAAANYLTPVSLELGGKSPTIVDEDLVDIDVAVNRVVWGKCVNVGQTCIAPDYMFVHEKHYDTFLKKMRDRIELCYGKDPKQSPDLCRIVSSVHFNRLKGMLDECKDHVYYGGETDESQKYIAPTIIAQPPKTSKVMSEEIFGPILPVYKYKNLQEVIDYINAGEKPLSLYVFTSNDRIVNRLIRDVSSGSIVQNDTLFQFANVHTPFGGVGHSGVGGYHGKYSFDAFSHKRSTLLRNGGKLMDVPIRYPPYTPSNLSMLRFLTGAPDLPPFPKVLRHFGTFLAIGVVAVAVASLAARGPPSNWF